VVLPLIRSSAQLGPALRWVRACLCWARGRPPQPWRTRGCGAGAAPASCQRAASPGVRLPACHVASRACHHLSVYLLNCLPAGGERSWRALVASSW